MHVAVSSPFFFSGNTRSSILKLLPTVMLAQKAIRQVCVQTYWACSTLEFGVDRNVCHPQSFSALSLLRIIHAVPPSCLGKQVCANCCPSDLGMSAELFCSTGQAYSRCRGKATTELITCHIPLKMAILISSENHCSAFCAKCARIATSIWDLVYNPQIHRLSFSLLRVKWCFGIPLV